MHVSMNSRTFFRITILIDNPNSWMHEYIPGLRDQLEKGGHTVVLCGNHLDVTEGDILFMLSCDKIVPETTLHKNSHNIVIHPSDLPRGQGFSPLTWQILEGKDDVPVALFEAVAKVDAGPIYSIHFEGHEINEELKAAQGRKTIEMHCDSSMHIPIKRQPSRRVIVHGTRGAPPRIASSIYVSHSSINSIYCVSWTMSGIRLFLDIKAIRIYSRYTKKTVRTIQCSEQGEFD